MGVFCYDEITLWLFTFIFMQDFDMACHYIKRRDMKYLDAKRRYVKCHDMKYRDIKCHDMVSWLSSRIVIRDMKFHYKKPWCEISLQKNRDVKWYDIKCNIECHNDL